MFDGDETNRLVSQDLVQSASMSNFSPMNDIFALDQPGKLSGDMGIPKQISAVINEWILEDVA